MSPRVRGFLCLVALCTLVGCSGFLPSSGDTPTTSPAPVPTTSPGSTPQEGLAPGLTEQGIENLSALKAAHLSVLTNTWYTAHTTKTWNYANGTLRARQNSTRRVAPGGARYHVAIRIEGPARETVVAGTLTHYDAYKEGSDLYVRLRNETSTRYRHATSRDNGSTTRVFRLFEGLDMRVTGEVSRAGRTLYRLESANVTDAHRVALAAGLHPEDELHNVSVQALVDRRGLVQEHRLRYTYTATDGTVQHGVWTVRYQNLGTTSVARPAWYADAVENTTDE